MRATIPRRIVRRIDQFAPREHRTKQQWMHPGIIIKTCTFRRSDEPGVLTFVRVELASSTGESVISDGWLVGSKQGRIRLEMPTCLLSDEGALIVRNLPTKTRKGIEAVVLPEFESWLRGAQ